MNNPIVVTDRSLTYYDSKLKGYIGSLYGCDMTVEWEPMENGKNYFKLKIALKNKHGAELFSKIVDFPLEQTIVSGSYDNGTKSLILYFQDGTSTSIPIEDLIEGLASKLDLERKSNLSEGQVVSSDSYIVGVPPGCSPYAAISKIGGMTYKDGDTLKDTRVTAIRSVGRNLLYVKGRDFSKPISLGSLNSAKIKATYKENTQYTFSWISTCTWANSSSAYLYLRVYYTDGTSSGYNYYIARPSDNKRRYTWTTAGGKTVSYISFLYSDEGTFLFEEASLVEGTSILNPYVPYTEHTITIPEEVQLLEGYGQSNPDNADEFNYIDLGNQRLVTVGHIVNGVWEAYNSTVSIGIPNIIGIEEGGTITLENEYGYGVPSEVEFYLNNNDTIGANKFVGELKGIAEVARYYENNGAVSSKTIAEVFDSILNAGSPIKITTESIGVLAQTQIISNISANILANPPVKKGDIILDRYLYGDAAYLCFWLVTDVQGGESDGIMTLQGAGNIYVGGGSASVADRATSDGDGNNIVSTYETKANAKSVTDEIRATSNSAYERATAAINAAQDSLNRVNRGVQSISADYTSGAGSIGTFYLRVNFVGGGSESYDITDELRGLVNDVLTYDR